MIKRLVWVKCKGWREFYLGQKACSGLFALGETCAGFCRHLCRHSRVLYELVCEWLCGLLLLAGLRALLQKLVAGFIATLAKGLRALRVGFLLA